MVKLSLIKPVIPRVRCNMLKHLLSSSLFSNYIVSAFRSLVRHKMNLVLTVIGLSIGLAAALMITLFTLNENSYDNFQPDASRTYRVVMHQKLSGNEYPMTSPHGYQFLTKVSGVEDVLNLINGKFLWTGKVSIGADNFKLEKIIAAPENLTDFIAIDVLQGDLATVLSQPNKIALSSSEALRLFGSENAVGKTFLLLENNQTMEVSAVFADFSDNSHYAMSSIVSAKAFMHIRGKISYTYLKLSPDADVDNIATQTTEIFNRIWQDESNELRFDLQPLLDIHLAPNFTVDMKIGGSEKTVLISIALSLLLLLISSFNYINMSIAQAGVRAKEVGVRKVLGASKLQLIVQFLTESVAIALISALFACGLVELLLPAFNQLVGRELVIGNWSQYLFEIIVTTVAIGIASGLYPAVFISSFSLHRVLSGDFGRGKTAILVRKSLMILQSALSVSLMIAAASLYFQLHHLQNLEVNYEKNQRLRVLDVPGDLLFPKNNQSFYQALSTIDGVISSTPIDFDLTKSTNAGAFVSSIPGVNDFSQGMGLGGVGFNAVQALGLQLIAGRDFSAQYQSDWFNEQQKTVAIIIPESVLMAAGYKTAEQAIGQIWHFGAGGHQNLQGKIVGVVKDVKIGSARNIAYPVLFVCGLTIPSTGSVVIEVNDQHSYKIQKDIINLVEQRLKLNAVEIELVEHNYQQLYQTDNQLVDMVAVFSALAVFLTCVGMFGLASFSAQQRGQEIAIRKVLGASRLSLMALLTGESIVLIGLSLLIAFPVSYYFINNWLNNFNERINQSFIIYIAAAIVVGLVTWFTVAAIALRTASVKPSSSLRYE
ncbi:MAG: putative ABC transport system permease protein [Colwellia sp.]|jgi:putative ABC transport system permease protein